MWEHLKDIFYFSRGEKNGIIVLLIILLIVISVPYISNVFISDEAVVNNEFDTEIANFKQSLVELEKPEYNNRLNQYIIERYDSIELFHFNPNKIGKEQFKQLGLTEKQIRTILNYRNKGGRFYKKDDFRKIYGIRYKQYQILKPYILLPDKKKFKKHNTFTAHNKTKSKDSLFVFDPNTISVENLQKLGLSEKQAKVVDNYRKKGGLFKQKEDFRKIYTISKNLHDKLEPYIFINSEYKNQIQYANNKYVDINKADIDDLVKIKGIGKYTAKLIIDYRTKLGGFVNVNQLKEIGRLNKNYFEKYKKQLTINKALIIKLSINFLEVNELAKHPYVSYNDAKNIVKYRTNNGSYTSINQIVENKLMDKSTYKKVEPYLKLN